MKKPFNVIIEQTTTKHHTCTITANTEDEAKNLISDMIKQKKLTIDDDHKYLKVIHAYELTEDIEPDYNSLQQRPYQTATSQYIDLYTLEDKTDFYVCNGHWWGTITKDENGKKFVTIHPCNKNENMRTFELIKGEHFNEIEIETIDGVYPED